MKTPEPLAEPRSRDSVWKQTAAGLVVAVFFVSGFAWEAWVARFFFPDHEPSMTIITITMAAAVLGALIAAPKLMEDRLQELKRLLPTFMQRGR